jgi:ribose 5-phosphate isomerase B
MRIALAADHGGFEMKEQLNERLRKAGHEVIDFGASSSDPSDDYPDFVIPLARAVAAGEVERGIVICGSGVGASVAANKVKGIRAGFSPARTLRGQPSARNKHGPGRLRDA